MAAISSNGHPEHVVQDERYAFLQVPVCSTTTSIARPTELASLGFVLGVHSSALGSNDRIGHVPAVQATVRGASSA